MARFTDKYIRMDIVNEDFIMLQDKPVSMIFFQPKITNWYGYHSVGGYKVEIHSWNDEVVIYGHDMNGYFLPTNERKLQKYLNKLVKKGIIVKV